MFVVSLFGELLWVPKSGRLFGSNFATFEADRAFGEVEVGLLFLVSSFRYVKLFSLCLLVLIRS